ncbi:MAG: formylglycine-generating enzyme family protein [Planctomycetaceae bacterium]|jgi:formylglycine-generating enzyme required for sulfatase activity|nr:formylglycine-generating enzyme family protein [Planctomycetaceae bacterium]
MNDQQPKSIINSVGMTLNLIPAGTFMMGQPIADDFEHSPIQQDHYTSHYPVTITKEFYMQTTVVTQGQWKELMGTQPWKGTFFTKIGVKADKNNPATWLTEEDVFWYCAALSAREGKTYRLPTEAEWEYACRAGTTTTFSFDVSRADEYAWYGGELINQLHGFKVIPHYFYGWDDDCRRCRGHAKKVGLKKPNPWGLYDMHGNVNEYCSDYYGFLDSVKIGDEPPPKKDPKGPAKTRYSRGRVLRGGCHLGQLELPSYRTCQLIGESDRHGFRVVRELD